MPFGLDLVLRGARERLAPILMTTLAAGLALVPMVVFGEIPGNEIEHPMAVVILGGLFTSTLLNLFVVPALYLRFGRSGRDGGGWRTPSGNAERSPVEATRDRQLITGLLAADRPPDHPAPSAASSQQDTGVPGAHAGGKRHAKWAVWPNVPPDLA